MTAKKTKLKEVKWNGVALNIKSRLKVRYQKAFVGIINSQSSEQEERISKSSKLAVWPVVLRWENMLDISGLDEVFPVIREMPKCSDALVCKWRVV